jgi:hypothetical protein
VVRKRVTGMKIPFGVCLVVAGGAGCAGSTAALPGVPVHPLMTETLRLEGTATPTLASPSCSAPTLAKPANVLELTDDTRVTIRLAAPSGEPALPVTIMRLTHLETNRSWCLVTRADGTPAMIGGEFPSGQYAVSVSEMSSATPHHYEVRVERL